MKFYLDEGLSPKIADILRKKGVDALSAHEIGAVEASDWQQLEFAAKERRCLVTRNRDDFVKLTLRFVNDHRPHHGILIIPHTIPGDQFSRMATLWKTFSFHHPAGLSPYTIAFLPT
ncbi:MAG: DUF5615 family PIN-like protein [Syntrophaceae bacterium]|nr:DUF5615 family PIN-like protein [Syntrophaceae bacterium]